MRHLAGFYDKPGVWNFLCSWLHVDAGLDFIIHWLVL